MYPEHPRADAVPPASPSDVRRNDTEGPMSQFSAAPAPQGLYDGAHEHDACGVAFVADLTGRPTRETVDPGLAGLCNLQHRGAKGGEPDAVDGAGILAQVPDAFLRAVLHFHENELGRNV